MSKNIFQILGFTPLEQLVLSHDVIDEAKDLFASVCHFTIPASPMLIQQSLHEEAYAISTAEDSQLTPEEAKNIEISSEQQERLCKYRDSDMEPIQIYDQLEYENIFATTIKTGAISFKELSVNAICLLHQDLTIGLDDYGHAKGVSKYMPGNLRTSDDVRVGTFRKYQPPLAKNLRQSLQLLLDHFAKKSSIHLYDILTFHILFYALHPFQNGNKRVIRLLESRLLQYYDYSPNNAISLAVYYQYQKDSMNFFLLESLHTQQVTPFVNFAARGYISAGVDMFYHSSQRRIHAIIYKNCLPYIYTTVPIKHHQRYEVALSIFGMHYGELHRSEFIQLFIKKAKKIGVTKDIAVQVLTKLLELNIIQQIQRGIYTLKGVEFIKESYQKITKFIFTHNLDIELKSIL